MLNHTRFREELTGVSCETIAATAILYCVERESLVWRGAHLRVIHGDERLAEMANELIRRAYYRALCEGKL